MLQILLPPETEAALRERAGVLGEDVAIYAVRLLRDALSGPTVDDLLRPYRQQVDGSGATDEELDSLCQGLRQEVWDEQQARKVKGA